MIIQGLIHNWFDCISLSDRKTATEQLNKHARISRDVLFAGFANEIFTIVLFWFQKKFQTQPQMNVKWLISVITQISPQWSMFEKPTLNHRF